MRAATLILLVGLTTGTAVAHSADALDRIGVPGPLAFSGQSFQLAWTSRPAPAYFKQEYVPAGETVERYEHMVLVEAHRGHWQVQDALLPQLEALKARRATDPLVSFDVIQNPATGEVILDFILSATDANGQKVVEWNAYRYAISADPGGESNLLLFGISRRAYGGEVRAFLANLREERRRQIDALAVHPLPAPDFADN